MDDFHKLLARISNAHANTRLEELIRLMESAGFKTKFGSKGDIVIFTNSVYHVRQTVAKPHHGPLLPVYIRDCLKAIEKVQFLQGNTDA